MLKNPSSKYRPFPSIPMTTRRWPSRTIERAPIWLSTDLRDGNQALFEPMGVDRKLKLFRKLVEIGFKEIEVAFPSASDTDFSFVRTLIEGGHVPDDVTIGGLTQARDHLIRRTVESLRGARRAIVHLYNATARPWREQVFGLEKPEVIQLAVDATRLVRELTDAAPETEWVFQYSPETFSATELEFAREISDAVAEAWGATPERKMILNLPATVEMATPNVFADQVEWMHRRLQCRDSIILSVHPHNDRGTGVAAAELAQLAGAERVEGCLFGNGERTGNVDIVTLALNLYTQGIDPGLDFSDIDEVGRVAEYCTQLPIHPRHPYVGDLVYTAFSGSHQDAIKKGFAARRPDDIWEVPYLPIDPADVGRSYQSIIRVNSQSGKGGIAYLLESAYGMVLPRRLQIDFSSVVQLHTDQTGAEVTAAGLWALFTKAYLDPAGPLAYREHHLFEHGERQGIRLTVEVGGQVVTLVGEGNGPIDATLQALGMDAAVHSYEERSMGAGADSRAAAFIEVAAAGATAFGVGVHANIITSSVQAVLSGINRCLSQAGAEACRDWVEALVRVRKIA